MPYSSQPLSAFSKLDQFLSPQGAKFKLAVGQHLLPQGCSLTDVTIVLNHGATSFLRHNDRILYGILQGPMIFGLSAIMSKKQNEYELVAETECEGYYIPARETLLLLERKQLWREAFQWIAWLNEMYEMRDSQLIGRNNYQQICSTLLMINSWEPLLRSRIGVLNYIHQRTHISRTVVANILSELRKGNYIQMEKGKLVGITHLPHDY